MRLRYLGYACQNMSLGCTTGRTFRLANLTEERAEATIAENLDTLLRLLQWNLEQEIYFFRISSDVVPFASHPQFTLDWRTRFADRLAEIRRFVAAHGLRLSMHPGQYTVLNSPNPSVVEAALAELAYQADFIEAVDPQSGTLTLHVGGAYGDKPAALERFTQNFARLTPTAQARLTVENDDKVYHVVDVLGLCEQLSIPLIFDYFHHLCYPPEDGPEAHLVQRLERVVATWKGRVPKFHLSSQREGTRTSHADYVLEADLQAFLDVMESVGGDAPFDVMLEAKQKDLAVLPFVARQGAPRPAGTVTM